MKGPSNQVVELLQAQDGVITRLQAMAAGITGRQIDLAVGAGAWERMHPGVYRLAGAPVSARSRLLAACAARHGAVASHESAAWVWALIPRPPPLPTLSVARTARSQTPGIVIRRVGDLHDARIVTWDRIPCTNPLRTLVDLAGVAGSATLDGAVDRALASGLVTTDGLAAEISRLSRRGRRGVGILRGALGRRGHIGVPHPSDLESRLLRLLGRGGVQPKGVEVCVDTESHRYRLDVVVTERVALEVDGYVHHGSAHALARDLHRHNELGLLGWVVLRFTWMDIVANGSMVLLQVHEAMRRFR